MTGLAAVVLIAAGTMVAQSFGRFTYGVLLPAARDDLGISNTVAGLLGTINVTAYLVGTVAVGVATGRQRLIDVMRFGLLLATVGLVLAAASTGPLMLGVALTLTGVGGAATWIPAPLIATGAVAPERRSVAIGSVSSGIGIGLVFTSQLAAILRSAGGNEAWRTVYVIQAAMAVTVLVATVRLIGHDQDRPSGPTRSAFGGFGVLRVMPGWLAVTLAYSAFGFMYLLVIAFLTARLEDDSGWATSQASLAFTLLGVAVIFGGPLSVMAARRIGVRAVLMAGFIGWSVLAVLILPGWTVPSLAFSVGLGLLFAAIPTTITFYFVEHTTTENYGPSFAAGTLAFGLAQVLSPQIGGAVADLTGSFTLVFVLSAVVAVVGSVAAFRLGSGPGRDVVNPS